MSDPSEADVKAAQEAEAIVCRWLGCNRLQHEAPRGEHQRWERRVVALLASARAEGEAAGKRGHHRNWPDCPSCVKWANDDMSASEAYSKGEAAGAAKEREAVAKWLEGAADQLIVARQVRVGTHLRALTPEGKR